MTAETDTGLHEPCTNLEAQVALNAARFSNYLLHLTYNFGV